ncbi:hypothetical protein SDC9_167407 [bioreactor metagenome]|uniref:Uncharacterized protein n=1 Tax=bioreactor metagenome TaxID=1076179 RepID=A0A645FZP9_9ZZZZ
MQAACHAFGVIGHVVQRHADRAVQPLADHAQRIAHQNAFHASRIGHRRIGGVVGGDHGDLLARLAHLRQARQADGLALRHGGCGRDGSVGGCGHAHGCASLRFQSCGESIRRTLCTPPCDDME